MKHVCEACVCLPDPEVAYLVNFGNVFLDFQNSFNTKLYNYIIHLFCVIFTTLNAVSMHACLHLLAAILYKSVNAHTYVLLQVECSHFSSH